LCCILRKVPKTCVYESSVEMASPKLPLFVYFHLCLVLICVFSSCSSQTSEKFELWWWRRRSLKRKELIQYYYLYSVLYNWQTFSISMRHYCKINWSHLKSRLFSISSLFIIFLFLERIQILSGLTPASSSLTFVFLDLATTIPSPLHLPVPSVWMVIM
jgi:hypothetical protein